MNDFAWIALIIIVYIVVIKPMMGGMLNQPVTKQKPISEIKKNQSTTHKNSHDNNGTDYVDYEEVK